MVLGDHDGPSAYYRALEASETLSSWNLANRVVTFPDLRLLGIDSCIEGETSGRINSKVLPLMAKAVESRGVPPLVVVTHHPPIPPGLRDFDETAWLERAPGLLDILQGAESPPMVHSGHVHSPYQACSKGDFCFVAGSPMNTYTSALSFGESPVRFHGHHDFYFVHEITSVGRHVATPQHVSLTP